MRHQLTLTLDFDAYSAQGDERAPAVLIAALRSTHELFSRCGITIDGKAETNDDVRIQWAATKKETTQ